MKNMKKAAKKVNVFSHNPSLPCEDDIEVDTFKKDVFIESNTPESLLMAKRDKVHIKESKTDSIPFWAKALFNDRPFSIINI